MLSTEIFSWFVLFQTTNLHFSTEKKNPLKGPASYDSGGVVSLGRANFSPASGAYAHFDDEAIWEKCMTFSVGPAYGQPLTFPCRWGFNVTCRPILSTPHFFVMEEQAVILRPGISEAQMCLRIQMVNQSKSGSGATCACKIYRTCGEVYNCSVVQLCGSVQKCLFHLCPKQSHVICWGLF